MRKLGFWQSPAGGYRETETEECWRSLWFWWSSKIKREKHLQKSSFFTYAMFGNLTKHDFCAPEYLWISIKADIGVLPVKTQLDASRHFSETTAALSKRIETERPAASRTQPLTMSGDAALGAEGTWGQVQSSSVPHSSQTPALLCIWEAGNISTQASHTPYPLPWNTWQ